MRFSGQTEPIGRQAREDTIQLLHWLVLIRVVVSAFIPISTFLIQLPETLTPLYVLVAANVLVNLLAAFYVGRVRVVTHLTYFLIYWDFFFVTTLVYMSGGIDSPFSFLYIISLIYGGLVLATRGAVIASAVCVMSYGAVMLAQYLRIRLPLVWPGATPDEILPREIFFKVLINGIAFFIAAFLSNLIAEQLRKTGAQLAEKKVDLEVLRRLHENIVRSVEIGLITTDQGGRITFVNPSGERILGSPMGKIVGRRLGELYPPILDALAAAEGKPGGPGQGKHRWEAPWKKEDGEVLHLGFSVSALQNPARERVGWIVSFQDLTRLRRMEQDIQRADRLASVGKLAAGIAHEVRNPLASISGSIQVLSSELTLDSVNGSLMEIVLRETDRLNRLITDFLDFARPGKITPELIDLNLLLDEVLAIVRHADAEEGGVLYRRDFAPDVFIRADSGQMRQLFLNLLLNAVQAMPRGGRIEVTTGRVDGPDDLPAEWTSGEAVFVGIEDTGEGMTEEVLTNLFDPFYTTKAAGTGLGLTVAYRIVETHGGRIEVDSEPGRGTRFTVWLPTGDEAGETLSPEMTRGVDKVALV